MPEDIKPPDFFHTEPPEPSFPGATHDSPDQIVHDLLQTEKEIASETLHLVRSRLEREKTQLNSLYADKQRELLAVRQQLAEAHEHIRRLQSSHDEERQHEIEQLHRDAQTLETQKTAEAKKWDAIAEKVKEFREAAAAAQAKLLAEMERSRIAGKEAQEREKELIAHWHAKEEDILQLKEQSSRKEEVWLKERAVRAEELHALQEQLSSLHQTLNEERRYQQKTVEKKDSDIDKLQKALQETVIHLNQQRRKQEESGQHIAQMQQRIQELENELMKNRQEFEHERIECKKASQEEQQNIENIKKEAALREETLRAEWEDQTARARQALSIAEQQFAEELNRRQDMEKKLAQNTQEIERLEAAREEVIGLSQKSLAREQGAWKKRADERELEFDLIRKAKDEELARFAEDGQRLRTALQQEKNRANALQEENQTLTASLENINLEKQKLIEHLNFKEKDWQTTLINEQELSKKQEAETKFTMDALVRSREDEINRGNEEIKTLSAQLADLRRSVTAARSDYQRSLERIQELEKEEEKNKELSTQLFALRQQLEVQKIAMENFDIEKAGLAAQREHENREHEKNISDLQRKLAETIALSERSISDIGRKEQYLRLEKEQDIAQMREEMERLRQQLNREVTIRQSSELKNTQLTDKIADLNSQLRGIHEEVAKERASFQEEAARKHQLLEQKHAQQLEQEHAEKEEQAKDYEKKLAKYRRKD